MKYLVITMLLSQGATYAKNKVVYGQDNRMSVSDSSEFWQVRAKAVASMHKRSKLLVPKTSDKVFKQTSVFTLGEQYSLCEDERFVKEPVLSDCTGFLISEDTLVSAGHCFKAMPSPYYGNADKVCEDYVWVFDYTQTKAVDYKVQFSKVYECGEVLVANYSFSNDFAIIKLKSKVSGVKPLSMSREISKDSELIVVGHPSGLPKKVAPGGKVIEYNPKANKFYASLDSFQGNSGSPVFNKLGDVVGILVSGKTDYIFDEKAQCQRVNRCDQGGKSCLYEYDFVKGEGVTNINPILDNFQAE